MKVARKTAKNWPRYLGEESIPVGCILPAFLILGGGVFLQMQAGTKEESLVLKWTKCHIDILFLWSLQWPNTIEIDVRCVCHRKDIYLNAQYSPDRIHGVTRMHSSRMRTARSLPYGGGVSPTETPVHRVPHPRGQTNTCENITFANFVCGR